MASLFDRDVKTIGKHINTIFTEGELEENSTVAKFATVAKDGASNLFTFAVWKNYGPLKIKDT